MKIRVLLPQKNKKLKPVKWKMTMRVLLPQYKNLSVTYLIRDRDAETGFLLLLGNISKETFTWIWHFYVYRIVKKHHT